MNLTDFYEVYPDEEACEHALKEFRKCHTLYCPVCGGLHLSWDPGHKSWTCMDCGHEVTLCSGTVMQGSNLPVSGWFVAMFLIASTKRSISALEVQRQLGRKRYRPVREMMHKPCDVIGKRDSLYRLFRMEVIPDLKAATEEGKIKNSIDAGADAATDTTKSYASLTANKIVAKHKVYEMRDKVMAGKVLPWVHISISNAKRSILDTYHDIKGDFLQLYLNEFCDKFNRRYFGFHLFDRLELCACTYRTSFKHRIY